MKTLSHLRSLTGVSQRQLAIRARVAYKSIQLIEAGGHDVCLSTLENVATGFGYSRGCLTTHVEGFFSAPPEALVHLSRLMIKVRGDGWMLPFFNFVDAFQKKKDMNLVSDPPDKGLRDSYAALLASTVECLCHQAGCVVPGWTIGVSKLKVPWFVSGIDNLKASALVESPVWYRQRNIFVLANFLERA